jgi:hypothetical protein
MPLGRAGGHLPRPRRAPPLVRASVAEFSRQTLAPDDLGSYPSADDGLPHRWDCETADVLYWERYRRRDSAGPEAPAIPTIAGKSLQIPNFTALLLFC